MREFLLWIEFGKSCKCGDKSNYLTPAAAGTVGGNIPGVESAPCGFVNPHSWASKPTARLQRLDCAASQTRNSAALKPHSAASKPHCGSSKPHTVASRCGFKSWHVTTDSLPFILTSKPHCAASLIQNSSDLKPHYAASKPHCTASLI